jgi:predicted porin
METAMNNKVLAAALAAAVSGGAMAQTSVQVYGLLDTGVEYVTNGKDDGGNSLRVSSGGSNNSRFGFRGSEDLGGGLKAIFQLESPVLSDTGEIDGPLFRRQANVGLEGKFGRVIIGRSFTTVYDFINPFDPMGYAPRYSWAPTGGGTLSSKYGMTTAFDNMVKYQGEFAGVKVGASFGAGESQDSNADGRKLAVGVAHQIGGLRFVLTGERVNGVTGTAVSRTVSKVYHAGLAYELTKSTDLKMALRNYRLERPTGGDVRADTWWIGANHDLTPVIDLTGVVYYINVKDGVTSGDTAADPLMFVFRTKYTLSKRTNLYATVSYAKAQGGIPIGVSRDSTEDGGVTGVSDNQTGIMLGMQHRF